MNTLKSRKNQVCILKSTIFAVLLSGKLCCLSVYAQAPLISLSNGKLLYGRYANQGQTDTVNIIPDFSHAGYKGGGVKLPIAAVKEIVKPVKGDCRAVIQAAIDKVSAMPVDSSGLRGAVLLSAGVYPIDGSLYINTNGVVLRGEGNGVDGTVLIAIQKRKHDLVVLQGSANEDFGAIKGSKHKITPYVATGAKLLIVKEHSLKKDDNIILYKTPNKAWIRLLKMAQYGWKAKDYAMPYERKIVWTKGDSIEIDIPIVDPIQKQYGGAHVFKSNIQGRLQNAGIENIRMESDFASDNDEEHGWNAVALIDAENCWVKELTAKFFGYAAVNVKGMSRFVTIEDCAMVDPKSITTGGRKYSFNIEGNSNSILFQRCMTWGGRHDFVSGRSVPGPNVFLDCVSDSSTADIGPHHRWSTGQLYDNVYGGQIRVRNRRASGTGHGYSGAQILFWNCVTNRAEIEVESPPAARNWGIGCMGPEQKNNGYWESWGKPVLPRSLYLQQLQERLGPQAVMNIATEDQLLNLLRRKLRFKVHYILSEPKVAYQ